MLEALFRKLKRRDVISREEEDALRRVIGVSGIREFGPREDLVRQGDRPDESTLIVEGWTARYAVLEDGRRQITSIDVPGDFIDLHSFLIKSMDHSIVALSPCRVVTVPHAELERISVEHPHLTRMFWLSTLIDAAIQRTWLVSMGRRSSVEHMAHLICELYVRLEVVGLTNGLSFSVPLTQQELADVMGISDVHTNRTLQELRQQRLFVWKGRTIEVLDWERLQEVAEFDPTYLHLVREHH